MTLVYEYKKYQKSAQLILTNAENNDMRPSASTIHGFSATASNLAVPWQPKLAKRMSMLLPCRRAKTRRSDDEFPRALKAFHASFATNPESGRSMLLKRPGKQEFLIERDETRRLSYDPNYELIMHSHRREKIGFPSLRDTAIAPVWRPIIPHRIIQSRFFPHDVLSSFVFSESMVHGPNQYELSAHWRIRNAATAELAHSGEDLPHLSDNDFGDQVGLVTFTRWTTVNQKDSEDCQLENLFLETGLVFNHRPRERIWLSLDDLYRALHVQAPEVSAHLMYDRDAPDTLDTHAEVPLPLRYRKRRWPASQNSRHPYITISTSVDTLAIRPHDIFARPFTWEKSGTMCSEDHFLRNLWYRAGVEISYSADEARARMGIPKEDD